MLKKVRYLLVGVGGNVYQLHEPGLKLACNEVVGVCDLREDAARRVAAQWGCPYYVDYQDMIGQTEADALVVMAPHFAHKDIAIAALQAGLHVLCEKPMGLQVGEADEMNAAAASSGKLLAINFQQRLRPEIVAAKRLLDDGRLGTIQHVDVKITWTRTYKYYAIAGWRGRWDTEGGALLMNQAPHDLDLICYLAGLPSKVHAWTPTIAHQIRTEDTVQAMMQWPNGALGSFHASTAEAGQPQRFEIIGTRGFLQINEGSLQLSRFETDVIEFLKTSPQAFSGPEEYPEPVALGDGQGLHVDIHQDFCDAILNGTAVIAPGYNAIHGLELANAMTYSNYSGTSVDIPIDRQKYAALLERLCTEERESMKASLHS